MPGRAAARARARARLATLYMRLVHRESARVLAYYVPVRAAVLLPVREDVEDLRLQAFCLTVDSNVEMISAKEKDESEGEGDSEEEDQQSLRPQKMEDSSGIATEDVTIYQCTHKQLLCSFRRNTGPPAA